MLHVRRHLFQFLFVYFKCFPDTDIMTLLRYFVCCILIVSIIGRLRLLSSHSTCVVCVCTLRVRGQVLGLLVTYFALVVQFGIPFESSTASSVAAVNNSVTATP